MPILQIYGGYTLMDSADQEEAKKYKWYKTSYGYAATTLYTGMSSGKVTTKCLTLHRLIMRPEEHEQIDHINGDKLDNRRKNLRTCGTSQNAANRKLGRNNHSGFKGVDYNQGKWRAQIKVGGKSMYLGRYLTPELAHRAYCDAARRHFHEFARFV